MGIVKYMTDEYDSHNQYIKVKQLNGLTSTTFGKQAFVNCLLRYRI